LEWDEAHDATQRNVGIRVIYPRHRRAFRSFDAAGIARHYEDAARIIRHEKSLVRMECSVSAPAREMLARRGIRRLFGPNDSAFALNDPNRRQSLGRSYDALAPLYWEARIPIDEAVGEIVGWLERRGFTGEAVSRP